MNYKLIVALILTVILVAGTSAASAKTSYLTSFNQHYDTEGTTLDSCALCHTGSHGDLINSYGRAYSGSRTKIEAIEDIDSDNDGVTNIEEIEALTFPGNSDDFPQIEVEPVVNTTNVISNDSRDYQNTEVQNIEEFQNHEINNFEEPVAETTNRKETPGFGAFLLVLGLLAAINFNKN